MRFYGHGVMVTPHESVYRLPHPSQPNTKATSFDTIKSGITRWYQTRSRSYTLLPSTHDGSDMYGHPFTDYVLLGKMSDGLFYKQRPVQLVKYYIFVYDVLFETSIG